jgi:hypothetical protein
MSYSIRPRPFFSKTLRPNGTILFLDVYAGRQGGLYLSLCGSRKGKDGTFTRIRLFLNPEAVPELRDALGEVCEFFQSYRVEAQA